MRRILTVAAAVAGLVLGSGSAAVANNGGVPAPVPVLAFDVTTAGGFTLPASRLHAGYITFTVSTSETGYHGIQGFRVNPGHTAEEVVNDLRLGVQSADPADNAAGALALQTDAVLIGGVVTSAYAPISVTVQLCPGTYYFFDLNDFFTDGITTPRLHTLETWGGTRQSGRPAYDGVIETNEADHTPGFNAPVAQHATGTYKVVNTTDEVHEVVWRSIVPGTTDAYIQTYYDAVVAGTPRPPRPWLDRQHGLQAMSPGQTAYIHINLPVGAYALLCLVPDDADGMPHAYMGMHKVVDLS
ncbi:hypothetical protein Lfu02_64190 [Longispora fulva]|uniref:Uncharacterized protein n=1 Tax=Longispora fulva TaxID=619741 RepID=A0A8J7GJK7_9ACTN|nr:hypothetical protein [Longispora fulva]MBG6137795.1 hypothetical protein [Longispora fulva]GIG62047.1 hypothetical protein Lfu02_64190 [Longispora fulva]